MNIITGVNFISHLHCVVPWAIFGLLIIDGRLKEIVFPLTNFSATLASRREIASSDLFSARDLAFRSLQITLQVIYTVVFAIKVSNTL